MSIEKLKNATRQELIDMNDDLKVLQGSLKSYAMQIRTKIQILKANDEYDDNVSTAESDLIDKLNDIANSILD